MEYKIIEDSEDLRAFNEYLKSAGQYKLETGEEGHILKTSDYDVLVPSQYIDQIQYPSEYSNKLIFGKDLAEEVVSIEVKNDTVFIFKNNGEVETQPMIYWVLAPRAYDRHFKKLEGNLHYKYIRKFRHKDKFLKASYRYGKKDKFVIWNEKESAMIYYGLTMFKGLKTNQISTLSFDIEAEGLTRDQNSQVFLITNTFRDIQGDITKKHFRVDNYNNDKEMIQDWCEWVVSVDPTTINGHNIFGYDLPYLQHCYSYRDGNKETLPLGKYAEPIEFDERVSKFRVDGAQTWDYRRIHIFGRHIIDGAFLAVKYDIGRKYVSWGLKQIAEQEGLIKKDRQFYDASKIGKNWHNLVEREKIVQYGIDDSDDSLALYDLMIPSIFYMTQSVPKPFQLMGLSASGAQLNSIMVRAYMQDGHSLPKASEKEYVAGGMSYGVPGIYSNVVKWDAKSYYPSTILEFDIYDKYKDPKNYFLEMVRYFTYKRFDQKDQYKRTGDSHYNDLQNSSKVFINSSYGLLATPGLNFNSYSNAAKITRSCRAGLQKAVIWATGKDIHSWWEEYMDSNAATQDAENFGEIDKNCKTNYKQMNRHDWKLVNLDTDSLSFCKQDETPFTEKEYVNIKKELNKIMYSEWEDDGSFDKVLVIKAKNYVLVNDGKVKKKGSSITDTKKEPAMIEMLDELIKDLLDNRGKNVQDIYLKYIKEAYNIQDINRWTAKRSITKAVLNPTRTNEQKILDAIKGKGKREGDKVWIYAAIDGERQDVRKGEPIFLKDGTPKMIPNTILRCAEDWIGDHNRIHYTKRVYKTISILENVIDKQVLVRYYNEGNQKLLEDL